MLKKNFKQKETLVDNVVITDNTLSCAALGLYTRLLYLVNNKDYDNEKLLEYLMSEYSIPSKTFWSVLAELEANNYITILRNYDDNISSIILNEIKKTSLTANTQSNEKLKLENIITNDKEKIFKIILDNVAIENTDTLAKLKIELHNGYNFALNKRMFVTSKLNQIMSDDFSVIDILTETIICIGVTLNTVHGSYSSSQNHHSQKCPRAKNNNSELYFIKNALVELKARLSYLEK